MKSKIDELINLILENDLLFSIITMWRSLPIYYYTTESGDCLYRMNVELSEDNIEDCYLITDKVTKELQTYHRNPFSISVDCIVEFLRVHKNTIMEAMKYEPNSKITVLINKVEYTVTINKLCKTLIDYASLSCDVRIVRIVI